MKDPKTFLKFFCYSCEFSLRKNDDKSAKFASEPLK
jgi:hypothetical protein